MQAHRKTGKVGGITWRLLASALILVLDGFPLPATGQNPDASVGRPSVNTPVHRGTEIVGYSSGRPGYGIQIYATGTPGQPVGEGRVPPWGWGSVQVRQLQMNETITAVQVGEKTEGFASVGRTVEKVTTGEERQLNRATIDDPVFACQQGFWVSDLVEGAKIEYDTDKETGNLWTPYQIDFVVPGFELGENNTIKVQQTLPSYMASEYAIKTVKSNPLRSSGIKEQKYEPKPANTTLGSDVLKVDNLITGAKVDIYEGQPGERRKRIGGGIAIGSSTLFAIEPFTREGAWAEQSLCEGTLQSNPSDWAKPKTDISPPTIDDPICAGATSVTVFTTEPGGGVKLRVGKKQGNTFENEGTFGTSGGRTVLNYNDGKKPLAYGETVIVEHIIDSITSRPPAREDVASKSPARFNIANGIPCYQCPGAGPRFVLGQTAGPIFMASMCGIERNAKPQVEISLNGNIIDRIQLEEVEGQKGHFQKQWTNNFSSTKRGQYRARFEMGPYTEDKYFYVVQGCVDCAAASCYYPLQDKIVERVNNEEPQQIPIDVRNDVRLRISKTMLVRYPNEGIDQHNLLVTEGVKRKETCSVPGCTYDAWYVTARTAFWDSNCAQEWRDSGESETFECIWEPDYADQGFPISINRLYDVWAYYSRVIDYYGEIPNLFDKEVLSMAHVRCPAIQK